MDSFIFGLIFIQVSIFFIAGLLLLTILYKKMVDSNERAAAPILARRIRFRRSQLNTIGI